VFVTTALVTILGFGKRTPEQDIYSGQRATHLMYSSLLDLVQLIVSTNPVWLQAGIDF